MDQHPDLPTPAPQDGGLPAVAGPGSLERYGDRPDRDRPGLGFPRMTVGVMGSAGGALAPHAREACYLLGQELARRGCVLVTGACPGLPQDAVDGARSMGGTVIGISPGLNLEEHVLKYRSPTHGYDVIVYTGSGLMGREIENIRTCDFVIIVGGRSGTLGEFAIAYDEGKIIGVLRGTGGIADELHHIVRFVNKDTGSIVEYDTDPIRLLDTLAGHYRQILLPRYREIVAQAPPDGWLEGVG